MPRYLTIGLLSSCCFFLLTPPTPAAEPSNLGVGGYPHLSADGKGHIYVAFEGHLDNQFNTDIMVRTSSDNAATWSPATDVSHTTGNATYADMATERTGAIDVVWSDTKLSQDNPDIFFSRSTDNGKTWTAPLDIAPTPGASSHPAIAVGPDDSIHVVWCDTSMGTKNQDIYYTSSSNGGVSWAKEPLLPAVNLSHDAGKSSQPAIAVSDDGTVHVVWIDETPGHPQVYYEQNTGGTWSKEINVSNSEHLSSHPAIACGDEHRLYLTWIDNSRKAEAPDVWCAVSDKNWHFRKPINISNTPKVSQQPEVASDGGRRVAFVWSDFSMRVNNPDIFGRISTDRARDITNVLDLCKSGSASHPDLAFSGSKLYVVWQDKEAGDPKSTIMLTSVEAENIATGPALKVDQYIHGQNSSGIGK